MLLLVSETFEYQGNSGASSKKTARFSETFHQQSAREYSQEWDYDDLGNLLSLTFPEAGPERMLQNTYSRGLLTGVFELLASDNSLRDYASKIKYHENGMLKSVKYGSEFGTGMAYSQGLDPNWMPRIGNIAFGGALTYGNFQYDGVGNLMSLACGEPGENEEFRYDGVGRLTGHTLDVKSTCTLPGTHIQGFEYDNYGNLTKRDDVGLEWFVDPVNNRVGGFSYDVAGNLTEYGGFGSKTYSFDPFNNMESKNSSDLTFREPEEFYLYTADDERVLIWDKGPNIETIRLRGPGQLLLREYVNGGWTKDWIWRNGVALASVIPDGENEEVHHLIPDYLGSVRGITAEDGTVGPTPFFLPFGIPLIGDSTSDGEVVAYTGHERDFHDAGSTEDSLDYMHARHCSSWAGRFMSMDPMGGDPRDPQSWNRFAYVQNNPVNAVDPDGREILEKVHEATAFGIETGEYHTSTVVIPKNQEKYKDDPRFQTDASTGKRYVTFGAGPVPRINGKLVSDQNREDDANLSNTVETHTLDLQGRDEDQVIDSLFKQDENYQDDLDYDIYPASEGQGKLFVADDGYNSNSWNRGFLEAAGFKVPRPKHSVPGFDKPVPKQYFTRQKKQ